jgi:hypothetical protein
MADRGIATGLAGLDPVRRALLDLSLRRGLSDAELAELAGAEPADVARWRDEARAEIAAEAGLEGDALEAELLGLSDGDWLDPTPDRSRRRLPHVGPLAASLLAAAAIAVAVAVVILLVVGDGSSDPDSAGVETPPEREDARSPIVLTPLPGVRPPGRVTVLIRRSPGPRSIDAHLQGLPNPNGRYELWLYNSRRRSARLGHLGPGTGVIRARLPRRARRYRFLDLSREPKPFDARHSNQSLFRTRLRHPLEPRRNRSRSGRAPRGRPGGSRRAKRAPRTDARGRK